MHEFSLVKKEVDRLRDKVKGKKVSKVIFFLGRLAHGTPESIKNAFKLATDNTPLSGADLKVVSIEPKVKCSSCENIFVIEGDINLSCPKCGSKSNELISGEECYIDSVEAVD